MRRRRRGGFARGGPRRFAGHEIVLVGLRDPIDRIVNRRVQDGEGAGGLGRRRLLAPDRLKGRFIPISYDIGPGAPAEAD